MSALRAGSQNSAILAALQNGQTITTLAALHQFGCMRLASRINELRMRHGHTEIESRIIQTPSGDRVAEYYIPR